jgi:hypothetical protein
MDKLGKFGRRLVAVVLAVVLVSGGVGVLGTVPAAAAQTGDDGTTNWDFIQPVTHQTSVPAGYTAIRTAQQLSDIRNNLSGKYILMNDIDLASWGNWEPIEAATQGSIASTYFSGVLDGNGYAIKNLNINLNSSSESIMVGLFSFVANDCEIKNIGIASGSVVCYTSGKFPYAGGIAGYAGVYSGATITNCFNKATIKASSPTFARAGGIIGAGSESGSLSVSFCANAGEISVFSSGGGEVYAGGIVGETLGAATVVSNCNNSGEITAANTTTDPVVLPSSNVCAGGVVGYAIQRSKIENCTNSGTVDGKKSGGILGCAWKSAEVNNCFNDGNIAANDGLLGGIVGELSNFSNVKNSANIGTLSGNVVGGIAGSSGDGSTVSDCYNEGTITGDSIGGIVGSGNGTITNCHNNGFIDGVSAGGVTASGGTVKNCSNAGEIQATATDNAKAYAGGIAAYASIVSDCVNTGTVKAVSSTVNDIYVGGIVGYTRSANNTSIDHCVNMGAVDALSSIAKSYAGGLLGYSYSNNQYYVSTIKFSYNQGSVSVNAASAQTYGGGLVGYAPNLQVGDCYNVGSVAVATDSAPIYAGGLAGWLYSSMFSRCYNAGTITGQTVATTYVGSAVGYNDSVSYSTSFINCYALDSASEKVAGYTSNASPNTLTDTQMRQQVNFVDFDFDTVWEMPAGNGYPVLGDMPSGDMGETTKILTDNTTGVIVEGILSADTVLVVSSASNITVNPDTQELLAGYDITLQKNGQPIQPMGNVTVKIPIPTGVTDTSRLKVFRIETNGTQTDMNATAQGGYMVFSTNHFSWYAILRTLEPIIEKAIFPMECLNITQGVNGSTSHKGLNAIDNTGYDNGLDVVFAPFTGEIKHIYSNYGNTVWLESVNPVQYADGTIDYMTILFMHDDDISDLYEGKIIKQGQPFYREGSEGGVTGSHLHMECGKGRFSGSGWFDNGNRDIWGKIVWEINNSYLPYDALFIDTQKTTSIKSNEYTWKTTTGGIVSPSAPPENKTLTEQTSGISVVYPDGAIPTGAVLTVENLRKDSAWFELKIDGQSFVAFYDINLMENNQPVQPSGKVTVRIPFDKEAYIYHVAADGQKTDMKARLENGYLVFETDHFSVYGIAVNEQPPNDINNYFKLWGKVTKWKKSPLNWFLLIVCFGWIWMAF